MKNSLLILGLVLLATGCSNGLSEIFLTSSADPFSDTPEIRFMDFQGQINLFWKKDDGADSYILLRKSDSAASGFSEIYRGKKNFFEDRNGSTGERYIYRLDKIRGQKRFYGTSYSYGFFSDAAKDQWEDNNCKKNAVELEEDKDANLYFCSFYDGTIILDQDWFYVTIPSHRTAEVTLQDSRQKQGSEYTSFCWSTEDTRPEPLNLKGRIILTNSTGEAKKVYFRIIPNRDFFETDGSESFVKNYRLVLQLITKEST